MKANPQPHAVRGEYSDAAKIHAVRGESALEIRHTPYGESWQPGQLHSNLAWTHYRTLLRVDKLEARSFYEIEAVKNNWSARELERQINCLLYERLELSRDKKGLLRLARKGQEIREPLDVFKDPVVLEFLKIPASAKLVESDLEAAAEVTRRTVVHFGWETRLVTSSATVPLAWRIYLC